jgi:hypothetical protein
VVEHVVKSLGEHIPAPAGAEPIEETRRLGGRYGTEQRPQASTPIAERGQSPVLFVRLEIGHFPRGHAVKLGQRISFERVLKDVRGRL